MNIKRISTSILLLILLSKYSFATYPESTGFFVVSGFTSSRLLWVPTDNSPTMDLGGLGVVPNRIKLNEHYLVVVHSGNFAGFYSNLWITSTSNLSNAIQTGTSIPWTVLEFPQFTNAYDMEFVGNDIAFVSSLGLNQITQVNLNSATIVDTYNSVANPQDLLKSGNYLYVSGSGYGSGNQLGRFSLLHSTTENVTVGWNPQGLCDAENGWIYIACAGSSWSNPPLNGNVSLYNPTTNQVHHSTSSTQFSPVSIVRTSNNRIIAGGEYGSPNIVTVEWLNDTLIYTPVSQVSGGWQILPVEQDNVWMTSTTLNSLTKYDANWNILQTIILPSAPTYAQYHQGMINHIKSPVLPTNLQVTSLYPNPFNNSSKIMFTLNHPEQVQVKIVDINGRIVDLSQKQFYPIGNHEIHWKPENISSGSYLILLSTSNQTYSNWMSYIK